MDSLHFVFLGKRIPDYALASLELSRRHSGLRPVLVGNRELFDQIKRTGTEFIAADSFYDPAPMEQAARNITLDHSFRNGFWLKTLERFFVLEQLMKSVQLRQVIHAELDQLLFRVDKLLDGLRRSKKTGIFLPFQGEKKAVASVLYCNSVEALSSVLELAMGNQKFENEMDLLLRWSGLSPENAIALPTTDVFLRGTSQRAVSTRQQITASEANGLVDPAELGLWVGGRDPQNLRIADKPTTRFIYGPDKAVLSLSELTSLRFILDLEESSLALETAEGNKRAQLFNLHLHSKVHRWLVMNTENLPLLFDRANTPGSFTIPGARYRKYLYLVRSKFLVIRGFLRRKINGLKLFGERS